MLSVDDLKGLWRRAVLQREGQEPDVQTQVFWLQGPGFFVDLRQPAGRPSFGGVACLRDLTTEQVAWLASQEGFAGSLEIEGTIAEWHRRIDFQPENSTADRADLALDRDFLRETGTEAPYFEDWVRGSASRMPCWGARLTRANSSVSAYLVQVGTAVMFARSRAVSLAPYPNLTAAVSAAPSLDAMQDLVDFEISIGSYDAFDQQWLIEHSTLPFKEGKRWAIRFDRGGSDMVEVEDLDCDGRIGPQIWHIAEYGDRSIINDRVYANARRQSKP